MSSISVDSDRIAEAAQSVNRSASGIAAEVDGMMNILYSLADSWKGGASDSFQTLAQEWSGVQKQVQESLHNIREALAQAGVQYQDVEEANRKMFAR